MSNLAVALQDLKKTDEAEALHRTTEAAETRVLGEDHPDRLSNLYNLACLLRDRGEANEAESLFNRCLQGRRRMLGYDNLTTIATEEDVADLANNRGAVLEAESANRHIFEVRRARLGDSDTGTLVPACKLAALLNDRGAHAEAESILRWAVPEIRKHPELPSFLTNASLLWGMTLIEMGRFLDAEPHVREALERRRASLPSGHMAIASGENVLAHCLAKQGRFVEAEVMMLDSYPRLVGPPAWPKLGLAIRRMVEMYRDWGKVAEAGFWQAVLDDLSFPAIPFAP